MNRQITKYWKLNVNFKLTLNDSFDDVTKLFPTPDNSVHIYIGDDNDRYLFPEDWSSSGADSFTKIIDWSQFDESGEFEEKPYFSVEYKNTRYERFFKIEETQYDYNYYYYYYVDNTDNPNIIIKTNYLYEKCNVDEVFGEGEPYNENEGVPIWVKNELWKDEYDSSYFDDYSVTIYFTDPNNPIFADKDVTVPSIYRPFYMENYILFNSSNAKYMFRINNPIGLKKYINNEFKYYIGEVDSSIIFNDSVEIKSEKNESLYSNNNKPLLFENNSLERSVVKTNVSCESKKNVKIKYNIFYSEPEPKEFSYTGFQINKVNEKNELMFYGISFSVSPVIVSFDGDSNKYVCASVTVNNVTGDTTTGIRYFVTNKDFKTLSGDLSNVCLPNKKYSLTPAILGKIDVITDNDIKNMDRSMYSFYRLYDKYDTQTRVKYEEADKFCYAYELKNLEALASKSIQSNELEEFVALFLDHIQDGNTDTRLNDSCYIVAIYDPVSQMSDGNIKKEISGDYVSIPHNNFLSVMRIYTV